MLHLYMIYTTSYLPAIGCINSFVCTEYCIKYTREMQGIVGRAWAIAMYIVQNNVRRV